MNITSGHNNQTNREMAGNTPPSSYDIHSSQRSPSSTPETAHHYVVKMLRRLLPLLSDVQESSPFDIETTESVLSTGSVSEVARLSHVSTDVVYQRVRRVLNGLQRIVSRFESIKQQNQQLLSTIDRLERSCLSQNERVIRQQNRIAELEQEVERLKNLQADNQRIMQMKLDRSVKSIGLTDRIPSLLIDAGLTKVSDLVRLTPQALQQQASLTDVMVSKISARLSQMGLSLAHCHGGNGIETFQDMARI